MRRHHAQYALLLIAATTVRVIYEYEGQLRASSLASSLQPPRRLGCAVDDATYKAEAARVEAPPACGAITAVASYWVDAPAAGASPLFASRIIDATAENHRAVAAASGVRYVRGSAGHPRCGKMRFVLDTLATLEEGEWLLFLDGDAALSCGAWSAFARAACRTSSPQAGYRLAEPLSLIAGSKYGVFLVRNDAWARDYLDRFATALEARPLLCATLTSVWSTFPENAAAASVTTEADRCHYARVTSLLDHAPHLVSVEVEAKRDPDAVADFVAGVRNATACWTRHRARHRAAVLDRGRAILKPGIAPKPFVPIRYEPEGSTTTSRTLPARMNSKELRRAYDRAREELKTIELEARPKKRKIN